MFPTLRDVLDLESVRHGAPRVVAGETILDRPVRWVHVAEIPDPGHLLRGGELVLTTGIALPPDDDGLRRWLSELAEVGAVGVVVELGRRFVGQLPKPLVAAAKRLNLPLIELGRETPFVRITESVHALIVAAQVAELRSTEEIHQRFTEMSVNGARASEIVQESARLAGAPVVLENLARQVLLYDSAGGDAELLLDGWESFSRSLRMPSRTAHDSASGWLATTVGARGHDWGRLLIRCGSEPVARLSILAERAAATLALDRLVRRDWEGLERQVHRTLLTSLLDGSRPALEIALRAKALGIPLEQRHLLALVLKLRQKAIPSADPVADQARLRDLAEAAGGALREVKRSGLHGAIDETSVGVLLTLANPAEEPSALAAFADALHRRADRAGHQVVIGVGMGVSELREARRSLREADHVAEVALTGKPAPFHRLPDIGLRGLMHLLRDDSRLQTFVERELAPLLAHQSGHPKENLLGVLRAYLTHNQSKTLAAKAIGISRPAFYERLDRVSRLLGADLETADACAALYVALLAHDAMRGVVKDQ